MLSCLSLLRRAQRATPPCVGSAFLGMGSEDRCLGFLMVAACDPALKDGRKRRPETHLSVEWRE